MKDSITREDLEGMFSTIAEIMTEKEEELCDMDAKLGDGDLGLTMKKGFGAIPGIIKTLDEPDIGRAVMKSGMKMVSIIPSTMGFLMSSGLIEGGRAIVGCKEIKAGEYRDFLVGFSDGIIKRGKCNVGDRTVLDAIFGAAQEVEKCLESNSDVKLSEALDAAQNGAKRGVEATKNMEPKYGKAAVHKAKAAGIPDQGACAGLYMIQGIRRFGLK